MMKGQCLVKIAIPLPGNGTTTRIGHTSLLFLLFIAVWSWGYYLDRYQLLYSTSGVVYGAGYTDYNVVRIGLWIMLFVSVVLGLFLLFAFFTRRFRTREKWK